MKGRFGTVFSCILIFAAALVFSGCSRPPRSDSQPLEPIPPISTGTEKIELEVVLIHYPPYTNRESREGGMSFEIFKAAMEGSRFRPVPRFLPPARAEIKFLNGDYPVSLYNSSIFENYPDLIRMDVQNVIYNFFYNRDHGEITWNELSDLKGKRVTMLRIGQTTLQRKYLEAAGLVPVDVDHLEQAFRMLESGKVDLALSVDLSAHHLVQKIFPGNESIVMTDTIYRLIKGGPWFRITDPVSREAMETFRKGRERIISDGTLLRIHEKYYGEGKVPAGAIDIRY